LDLPGLINSIINSALLIDAGRKGFATRGKEQEGRISYEDGISMAMTAFLEALATADPQALILAEYAFITQEFALCDKSDKDTINSLNNAIQFFDDAFLALKAVEKSGYKTADETYPHHKDYRFKGFPKDSYHIAIKGHKTRLQNVLKSPGIDPIEKALLKQRLANMSTAQTAYVERQKKALSSEPFPKLGQF